MEANLQLVTLNGRSTITNSLIVAEVFGKEHRDVLRAIRDLQSDVSKGVTGDLLRNFAQDLPQPEERRREFGEGAGKLISEPIRTQPQDSRFLPFSREPT